ncbi:MAG: outer membrane beta-barrel protein, partial [Bacteroidota bacterium]
KNDQIMNKTFLLFVLIGSLAGSVFAQQGVKIGLRFSPIVSFATITDSSNNTVSDDMGSRVGLSYGLMLNYGLTDNLGFQSGVHIVTKGFNRSAQVDSVPTTQDVRITTVEIPVALRGRSPEIGNGLFITGLFGVSLDVSAGYRNQYTGLDPVTKERQESGTKSGANLVTPVNLSFIFGAGVDIEQDWGTVHTGLSFHRGLTNMNNRSNFGNQESIRVSYVALDLGYFF